MHHILPWVVQSCLCNWYGLNTKAIIKDQVCLKHLNHLLVFYELLDGLRMRVFLVWLYSVFTWF